MPPVPDFGAGSRFEAAGLHQSAEGMALSTRAAHAIARRTAAPRRSMATITAIKGREVIDSRGLTAEPHEAGHRHGLLSF